MIPMQEFLAPTWYLDADHPAVRAYAQKVIAGIDPQDKRRQAVALFYAVRDDIRYNPYTFTAVRETLRASSALEAGEAFCIPKAVLLAAAGRAVGIPTRLGFADVTNHLASPRLLEALQTDVFAFHGYMEFLLDGEWVKATPAFNRQLCEKFGLPPLEWDGVHDAIFQPADAEGRLFMSYLRDRGTFADMPYDAMVTAFRETYPHWFEQPDAVERLRGGNLESEAPARPGAGGNK